MPTSTKNRTSSLPVPSVISVSSDEVMAQLHELWTLSRPLSFWLPSLPARREPGSSGQISPRRLGRLSRRRAAVGLAQKLLQPGEKVHRNWEDDGGVFLHPDFSQSLQVAQLDADRFGSQQMRGVDQALRSRKLTFRVNNLGPLLAFGLGLLGHGAQHGFRHIHLLHLD